MPYFDDERNPTTPVAKVLGQSKVGEVEDNVATPSLTYTLMHPHWDLPLALMGGQKAMQHKRQLYLPQEEKETQYSYEKRLIRSNLFPGFSRAIKAFTSKPFEQPVTLDKTVSPVILEHAQNIDNAGRNLTSFARDTFQAGVVVGVSYILVDMPSLDPAIKTLADQTAAEQRPYWCMYEAQDVLEVLVERQGSNLVIMRARLVENTVEQSGKWTTAMKKRIRVITPETWALYHQPDPVNKPDEWTIEQQGVNTLKKVPLVPFYTNRTGPYQALPPLEEMAELNLRHWQSNSDQINILHYARIPILFGKAINLESDRFEIGANCMVMSSDPQATLGYVETTGNGIKAGEDDLTKLEQQMGAMGADPLISRMTINTATEVATRDLQGSSHVQAWAGNLELAIEEALKLHAEWIGESLSDTVGSHVTVFRDFTYAWKDTSNLEAVIQTRQMGDLSRESYLQEMKRRQVLPDSFDVEGEMNLIGEEGPPLAVVGQKVSPPPGKDDGKADKGGTQGGGSGA